MSHDTTALPRGEERPAPKTVEELIILALDASGSMSSPASNASFATKADELIHHLISASDGLLQRLRTSRNRNGIELAVVTFDDRVDVIPPLPLGQLEPEDLEIDLLGKHGQATAIGQALDDAHHLAEEWLAEAEPQIPRFCTILLMSDGQETAGSDPVGVAELIKSQRGDGPRPGIVIASAAYGPDADQATLQEIASQRPDGSRYFKRVETGAGLRDFFLESLSTAAASRV